MLNRKENKSAKGAEHRGHRRGRPASAKGHRQRRRFVISPKAHIHNELRRSAPPKGQPKATLRPASQSGLCESPGRPPAGSPAQAADLTETIKTLLHLAQEHGHVTYDDINDILPDGLSPDDLDELYTQAAQPGCGDRGPRRGRARQARRSRKKKKTAGLRCWTTPCRMYMNQMGKVPLLTREQEVEICKRIEEAETDMQAPGLWPRLHGQGAHRHCREAAFRAAQGAF